MGERWPCCLGCLGRKFEQGLLVAPGGRISQVIPPVRVRIGALSDSQHSLLQRLVFQPERGKPPQVEGREGLLCQRRRPNPPCGGLGISLDVKTRRSKRFTVTFNKRWIRCYGDKKM